MTCDTRRIRSIFVSCASAMLIASGSGAWHSAVAQNGPNLFPGLTGPTIQRLRFGTGGVVNNQPQVSPILPNIPGPPSPWVVEQWAQSSLLVPNQMTVNNPATNDPLFGVAEYAFTASDGHSHVWIYRNRSSSNPVYELYESGGALTAGGGSNIFLSSKAPTGGIPLDQSVEYSLKAKISKAVVNASASSQASGAVLGQIFTGFVIQFPEPVGGQISTIFLQLPITRSLPQSGEYRRCSLSNGGRQIVFGGMQSANPQLPFATDNGPFHNLLYNINSYFCELLRKPVSCQDAAGDIQSWSLTANQINLRNWRIMSMYIGLESQNRDIRPQSTNRDPQGIIEEGIQISDLQVLANSTISISGTSCGI